MSNLPRHLRGFTLLELLVSVLLFALLAAAVHQSVRAVSRAADLAGAEAESSERLRAVADFLERHLSQALPVRFAHGGRPRLLFDGDRDRLAFVTLLSPLAGYSGPSEVVLEAPGGGSHTLRLAYRPLNETRAEDFGLGDHRTRVLATEVADLRFSYYGAEGVRSDPAWHDRWRDERRMPMLVRIAISLRDGSAWPDIVVRVRTDIGPVMRRQAGLGESVPNMLSAAGLFGQAAATR